MSNLRVGIIGAGAAGMIAAITAARKGSMVTLIEKNDRIGKKILMTGNGKCNMTNLDLSTEYYHSDNIDKLQNYFNRFNQYDVINFFNGLGLVSKNKNNYIYPLSEQASTVLDALRFEISHLDIKLITEFVVSDIYVNNECEYIICDGKRCLTFDRIIIALGGMSAPKSGSDGSGFKLVENLGHNINKTVPALCGLKCKENFFKSISGVRASGTVSFKNKNGESILQKGEIQFTDYGISGIPVFQISRDVNLELLKENKVEIEINLFDISDEEFNGLINSRNLLLDDRTVEEYFNGLLNKKIMNLFLSLAKISPKEKISSISQEKILEVFSYCRSFKVTVIGNNGYEQSQVTAGGVSLNDVDDKLQSIYFPGLYFAGEILDVDGLCGGYNLQWAWTSGFIAGHSVAE